MELAEESEHQRMGIFPSKAKVTAQGPWQTMEVFIRSSAPSPLNVCENVEKQSWSCYQQANSVFKKITVQSQSQWPQCISNFSHPSQNQADHVSWTTQSQLTGFQGSSCRRQYLRVSHISIHTQTPLMQISKVFRKPAHMQSAANVSQSPQIPALGRSTHYSPVPLLEQ